MRKEQNARGKLGAYFLLACLALPAYFVLNRYRSAHEAQPPPSTGRPPIPPIGSAPLEIISGTSTQGRFSIAQSDAGPGSLFSHVSIKIDSSGTPDPALTRAITAMRMPNRDSGDILNQTLQARIECLTSSGARIGQPSVLNAVPLASLDPVILLIFPKTYPPETDALRVTLSETGNPRADASWTIKRPVPSVHQVSDAEPTVQTADLGKDRVEAVAAEVPDFSTTFFSVPPREVLRPSVPHEACGTPVIECIARLRGGTKPPVGQSQWNVMVTHVDPEWGPENEGNDAHAVTPFYSNPAKTAAGAQPDSWLIYCCPTYPGQLKRVRVTADFVRTTTKAETVTFHDADLIYNPRARSYVMTWSKPLEQTSAFGRRVAVLNGRGDLLDSSPGTPVSLRLFLATRLTDSHNPAINFNDARCELEAIDESGKRIDVELTPSVMQDSWSFTSPPGIPIPSPGKVPHEYYIQALKPLIRLRYSPWQFTCPFSNPFAAKSVHLKTVRITYRDTVSIDRRHVVFVLPVQPKFDKSWLPDTASIGSSPQPIPIPQRQLVRGGRK
jgi:hypothetical protein